MSNNIMPGLLQYFLLPTKYIYVIIWRPPGLGGGRRPAQQQIQVPAAALALGQVTPLLLLLKGQSQGRLRPWLFPSLPDDSHMSLGLKLQKVGLCNSSNS
jgi:hypothetical protein